MNPLTITSNMYNERHQLEDWFKFVNQIADGGVLIVDNGSTDGTIEYARSQGAIVIEDDIIVREGYGPARNHLREMTRKHFPKSKWMAYFDGDERMLPKDFHQLRFLKEYLEPEWDVIAFPRIDWYDYEMTTAANNWTVAPDWQARMTRIDSPLKYVRRLHEQLMDHNKILCELTNPILHHLHRATTQSKRDYIGRLCAKLHGEDEEWGHTYPKHHKEDFYKKQLEENNGI